MKTHHLVLALAAIVTTATSASAAYLRADHGAAMVAAADDDAVAAAIGRGASSAVAPRDHHARKLWYAWSTQESVVDVYHYCSEWDDDNDELAVLRAKAAGYDDDVKDLDRQEEANEAFLKGWTGFKQWRTKTECEGSASEEAKMGEDMTLVECATACKNVQAAHSNYFLFGRKGGERCDGERCHCYCEGPFKVWRSVPPGPSQPKGNRAGYGCADKSNANYDTYRFDARGAGNTLPSECVAKPTARYLWIRDLKPDSKGKTILNLAEVQAYDGNGALIKPVGAKMSSAKKGYDADKCIDGDTVGKLRGNSKFCHSNPKDKAPWLRIDLGKETEVSKIEVHNRDDCCADRIKGAKIVLTKTLEKEQYCADHADTKWYYKNRPGGCAAAVWRNGKQAKAYCDGEHPTRPDSNEYFTKCCSWSEQDNACVEKTFDPEDGADTAWSGRFEEGLEARKDVQDTYTFAWTMRQKKQCDNKAWKQANNEMSDLAVAIDAKDKQVDKTEKDIEKLKAKMNASRCHDYLGVLLDLVSEMGGFRCALLNIGMTALAWAFDKIVGTVFSGGTIAAMQAQPACQTFSMHGLTNPNVIQKKHLANYALDVGALGQAMCKVEKTDYGAIVKKSDDLRAVCAAGHISARLYQFAVNFACGQFAAAVMTFVKPAVMCNTNWGPNGSMCWTSGCDGYLSNSAGRRLNPEHHEAPLDEFELPFAPPAALPAPAAE